MAFLGLFLCLLVCACSCHAGSFWHVSDIHWDPAYKVGAPSRCLKPDYVMCCENGSVPDPKQPNAVAGTFGDYNCDSPLPLVQSALTFLNTSGVENVSFVIWTGDDTPHNIFGQNEESNLLNIRLTSQFMKETFPNTVVIPVLGNHDYYPVSRWQMPPHCDWLLRNVSQWWAEWLPGDALTTFLIGGYYSILVEPGLRVVALNTNFYDAWDPYAHLLSRHDDPGGQLAWLNQTLYNATRDGEKVFITAHVAPGIRSSSGHMDVVDAWNVPFIEMVQQYYRVIAGQFYGHWHRDEFKIFRDSDGQPINVAWLTSSVTPYHDVNPSVRAYSFDDKSKNITDYRVYSMNLTQANVEGLMTWRFEYSPLTTYANLTDMLPSSWFALALKYLYDPTLFPIFYDLHTVGCPLDPCTSHKCMKKLFCSTTEVDEFKYQECYRL